MNSTAYVYLAGPHGRHFFTDAEWKVLLQMARDYGWVPAGTEPPEGQDELSWDRTYITPRGQRVNADDAARFAGAIERAMKDIPNGDQAVTAPSHVASTTVDALSYYRGSRRALLERLVTSARKGKFQIDAQVRSLPYESRPFEQDV